MSVDTDETTEDGRTGALARSLGEAIAELPVYQEFLDARRAVETDETAQAKIETFETARQEYLDARQRGTATEDDLQVLQAHQDELHDLPVMAEFLRSRRALEHRLGAINEQVSAPLAVDFGEKAGGCCVD